MRKRVLRTLSAALAASLLLGVVFFALASSDNPAVIYDGSTRAVTFRNATPFFGNECPDLFRDIKNAMPGDNFVQTIDVGAEHMGSDKVRLYLRIENENEDYHTLLHSEELARLEVRRDGQLLDAGSLAGGICLGTFSNRNRAELEVTFCIAPKAGNELQGLLAEVDWVFTAEEISPVPPPAPHIPDKYAPGLNTVDHYAYIVGYEDNTVRPNSYITRAEVATIFFRLMTDEFRDANWATESIYSDVMVGSWYNNAICTATQASILTGYTDGTMQPNKNITRAEFAAIAARFLSEEYEGEDMFTDISGHWAAEYINRAARAGWIKGNGDGKFRPNDLITRAEAVTLINAMLDRAPDKDHMLADMKTWIDNPETAWFYEAIQEATNSHDYERETIIDGETWTELLANRDWVALEKMWSDSHSAPGGEVADNLNPNTTGDGD